MDGWSLRRRLDRQPAGCAFRLHRRPVLSPTRLFGNDDQAPTPEQVNLHEEELKKHNKTSEFHRYDGAGHGFFYYDRGAYRQEQAVDGWNKIFDFLGKNLA